MSERLVLPHDRYVELQDRLMQDIDPKVYNSKGMKYWNVVDKLEFTLAEFGIYDASSKCIGDANGTQ